MAKVQGKADEYHATLGSRQLSELVLVWRSGRGRG